MHEKNGIGFTCLPVGYNEQRVLLVFVKVRRKTLPKGVQICSKKISKENIKKFAAWLLDASQMITLA